MAAPSVEITHFTGQAISSSSGISLRSVQRIWAAQICSRIGFFFSSYRRTRRLSSYFSFCRLYLYSSAHNFALCLYYIHILLSISLIFLSDEESLRSPDYAPEAVRPRCIEAPDVLAAPSSASASLSISFFYSSSSSTLSIPLFPPSILSTRSFTTLPSTSIPRCSPRSRCIPGACSISPRPRAPAPMRRRFFATCLARTRSSSMCSPFRSTRPISRLALSLTLSFLLYRLSLSLYLIGLSFSPIYLFISLLFSILLNRIRYAHQLTMASILLFPVPYCGLAGRLYKSAPRTSGASDRDPASAVGIRLRPPLPATSRPVRRRAMYRRGRVTTVGVSMQVCRRCHLVNICVGSPEAVRCHCTSRSAVGWRPQFVTLRPEATIPAIHMQRENWVQFVPAQSLPRPSHFGRRCPIASMPLAS